MNNIGSTRFGNVQANPEDIIYFKDGIVGFPKLKHCVLVESGTMPLVVWLQSTEDSSVAFPLIEPTFFVHNYVVHYTDADRCSLDVSEGNTLREFVILTIPSDPESMTANLRAPVVFNVEKSRGTQIILQDKSYELRVPAFEIYMRASGLRPIKQSASDAWNVVSIKSQEAGFGGGSQPLSS